METVETHAQPLRQNRFSSLLALGVAFVALRGVGVIAQHGFQLTAATGTGWHMASGMVVTFVGIGFVALGQVGLWRELVRRRRNGIAIG